MVPAAERLAHVAGDGCDVDDPSGAGSAHVRQHELAHPRQPEHVDLELAPGHLDGDVLDRTEDRVAGVVDEDVDAAVLGDDIVDEGHHRVVVAHVDDVRGHPLRAEGLEALEAPGGPDDGPPRLGEGDGGGLADARGGTGPANFLYF